MTDVDYSPIGPAIGDLFPDFSLPNADGETVRLHEWRAGRRALMLFFRSASW